MTDYAGSGPAAALEFSDPRVVPLRPGLPEPTPNAEADRPIVPVDDADRESEAIGPPASSTLEQRLETFIGFNCESYLDYYRQVFRTGSKNPLRHWHWVPFAFSTVWLFARRRYATAAVLGSVPLIANYVLPGGGAMAIAFAVVAAVCGIGGRPLYLALALRKVTEIEARRLWPVQRDQKLHRSGGVSVPGAVCGLALWAGTAALPFFVG